MTQAWVGVEKDHVKHSQVAFHAGEVNACRSPQWPHEATSSLISVLYSPTLPDGEAFGLSSLNQLYRWTLSEGWVQVGAGLSGNLKSILGFSREGSIFVSSQGSLPNQVTLQMLSPNGQREAAFHSLTFGGNLQFLSTLSEGRILILGSFTKIEGFPRIGIARLFADGSVDPSFDAGELMRSISGSGRWRGFGLQTDGSVILTVITDTSGIKVIRLLPSGLEDVNFEHPEFSVQGLPGTRVILESSSDLVTWGQVRETSLRGDETRIQSLAPLGSSPRFYRARTVIPN